MTVGIGKMKIQGVATCQYLCMDSCGLLYGSREFGDECVFNEMFEDNSYNTYSSAKYSNENRTMYLALNRRGQPRKVLLRAHQQLGRLSSYTRVLIRTASTERTDGQHPLRHHPHSCSVDAGPRDHLPETATSGPIVEQVRCRGRKKRKKKRRKCLDPNVESCQKKQTHTNNRKLQSRLNKKCESEDSEECQRVMVKKRHKNKFGNKRTVGGTKKKKKNPKGYNKNKKARANASTELPTLVTVTTTEEVPVDEDYLVDSTTHWEWEDSTVTPNESSTSHHD